MDKKIDFLIRQLEKRYQHSENKLPGVMESSSGSVKYGLHELTANRFNTYAPFDLKDDFRVAAVDGGNMLVYETPGWSIGLYKLSFRLFEVNLEGKTCNTVQKFREMEHDLVFLTREQDSEKALSDIRNQKEAEFTLKQIEKGVLEEADLLIVDGTLEMAQEGIINAHPNTVGVSKRSFHVINDYSASSYLALKAAEYGSMDYPWYCYPLVRQYIQSQPRLSEMVFGTFRANSNVFRLDFPLKKLNTLDENGKIQHFEFVMKKLALCSLDPKYKAYPYPLGAVHSDAVMRKGDKDTLQQMIKRKLSEYRKKGSGMAYDMIEKDILQAEWYNSLRKGAVR